MLPLQNAVNTYRMGEGFVEEAKALMQRYAGAPKNWMSFTPRFHYKWVCTPPSQICTAVPVHQSLAHPFAGVVACSISSPYHVSTVAYCPASLGKVTPFPCNQESTVLSNLIGAAPPPLLCEPAPCCFETAYLNGHVLSISGLASTGIHYADEGLVEKFRLANCTDVQSSSPDGAFQRLPCRSV